MMEVPVGIQFTNEVVAGWAELSHRSRIWGKPQDPLAQGGYVEPFFAEYLRALETMHNEFVQALDGLANEGVNWTPAGDANSLAVLAVHTAGAQRYWIGDVALGDPSDRDREAEFRTAGLTAEAALGPLQSTLLYVQTTLPRLTLADLEAKRVSSRDGREVTVSWALLHALEHTAMHAGHAQLTRQLWEAYVAGR